MANKRILDETTASVAASDDYLYIDGQTNGSRKITPENIVLNSTTAQLLATHISEAADDLADVQGDISDLQGADTDLRADLGDLEDLETTDKSSLVAAINEAATTGSSGGGGQPIPITLASQMSDTDAIYLYLGSETGYDYGYIYVYLSNAWTKTTLYGKGQDGQNGQNGTNGQDGYSPTASVTQTTTGATISITDANGTTTASVTNGTATDAQVATYVDAWLDDHPEATTTVADGSVTQAKLAFSAVEGVLSSNLIDKTAITSARFSSVNGNVQSFQEGGSYYNTWRMTDYIDVSDHIGEYISITNHNGYCFYNSNKTAISGSGESLSMTYPAGKSTDPILIPAGAYYIRLAYWYNYDLEAKIAPMANFGATLQEYSEYGTIELQTDCVFNDNLGEVIALENIEHDTLVEKVVSNNLIPPTNIKLNYKINRTTGEEESVASGYYQAITDWIPVSEKTSYYGRFKGDVSFYDKDKNYLGYSESKTFTTPYSCTYVRLVIDSMNYGIAGYYNQFYLVEGDEQPSSVLPYGGYLSKDQMERYAVGKTVLSRLNQLYDPTVKTDIGIYGDSNTAGLSSGASGTYYQNCWANLVCQRIATLFNRDVVVRPFGRYGSWYGTYYSGAVLLNNAQSFVSLKFYGSTFKVNFGQTQKGVASIVIDGGTAETYDTNTGTQYIASELSEDYHTAVITYVSGSAAQVISITVHKYATATNLGSTGSGTSYLPTNDTAHDIYITVLGTNNRGGSSIDKTVYDHYLFANKQIGRGAEVIMITPTPATDGFETGAQSGLKMADIESAVAGANGMCNLEHISFYQYLLNYCTNTGTALNSLFNDTLHMKESTHAIIYKFMCDKLGLGQPIDDYLPS